MLLFFDKELHSILDPDEVIFVSLFVSNHIDPKIDLSFGICDFYISSSYHKLFEYYQDEMPYDVAKCRTEEPDIWIVNKLIGRINKTTNNSSGV